MTMQPAGGGIRVAVATAIDTAQYVGLALWLGGVVAATWIAPAALAATAGQARLPQDMAGIETLRRLGPVAEVCGVVLIAAQYLLRRRYQGRRSLFIADGVRQLLTFAALLALEYAHRSVLPAVDAAGPAGRIAAAARLWPTLTALDALQVALLVAVAAVTAWLQMPRATGAGPAVAAERKGRG